ncbi:MAG: hypothetical protein Q8P90_04415 [bacterium]|nr:hypothetical protein [bacterium]
MEEENKINQLQQVLDNASAQLQQARQIMAELNGNWPVSSAFKQKVEQVASEEYQGNSQIVEGVFNGQNMVGPDGKIYTVPANYASKSKLVEGDIMKLTIRPDGSFIYKQIGPVERSRIVGSLVIDQESGDYFVVVGTKSYKVIKASITYYHGEPGDEVVILTSIDGDSAWAAVENVIRQGEQSASEYIDKQEALELPDGSAAELPMGDEAELADGSSAELDDGTDSELPSG